MSKKNNVNNTESLLNEDLSPKINPENIILRLGICFAIIAVFIYYPALHNDYDIWWHLALGEYYIQNQTIKVDHSIFSWTPADAGWIYNTWLGSMLLYIFYRIGGSFGLWIVQFSVLISILLLILKYNKISNKKIDLNFVMLIMLCYIAINLTAIYIKPELFTTCLFAIFVFIYFYTISKGKSFFLLYPLLMILWVNLHGGFLVGLAFISIMAFLETINLFFIKRNGLNYTQLKMLWLSTILCYVSVFINPYGIDYPTSVLSGMLQEEYMSYAKRVFAYLSMWNYLIPSDYSIRFIASAWIFIVLLVIFLYVQWKIYVIKRVFFVSILIGGLFWFFFGMSAGRYTIFFPLYVIFAITFLQNTFPCSIKWVSDKATSKLSFLIIIFFFLTISYFTFIEMPYRAWFNSQLDMSVPVKETDFLKKHKINHKIFNDYLIGGYLIWRLYPDYKVFIDPRYGPYWRQVGPDYFDVLNGINYEKLEQFRIKYPFKIAFLHMREGNLIFFMLGTGDWRLLYFDKIAAILVHKSILNDIPKDALNVDVGTSRFKDVSNPDTLVNLFNFYVVIGPTYAQEIYEIFNNNVSNLFRHKKSFLNTMQSRIAARQSQLMNQHK